MQTDPCTTTLNHVTNCKECKKQIILYKEEVLELDPEDISDVTVQALRYEAKQ